MIWTFQGQSQNVGYAENGQNAPGKQEYFRTIQVIFGLKLFRVTLSTILKQVVLL